MRLVWHVSCAFLLLFVVCCLLFAVGATAVFARIVREVPSSVYLPVVVVVVVVAVAVAVAANTAHSTRSMCKCKAPAVAVVAALVAALVPVAGKTPDMTP